MSKPPVLHPSQSPTNLSTSTLPIFLTEFCCDSRGPGECRPLPDRTVVVIIGGWFVHARPRGLCIYLWRMSKLHLRGSRGLINKYRCEFFLFLIFRVSIFNIGLMTDTRAGVQGDLNVPRDRLGLRTPGQTPSPVPGGTQSGVGGCIQEDSLCSRRMWRLDSA